LKIFEIDYHVKSTCGKPKKLARNVSGYIQ